MNTFVRYLIFPLLTDDVKICCNSLVQKSVYNWELSIKDDASYVKNHCLCTDMCVTLFCVAAIGG